MKARHAVIAVLATGALFVSACGDDDDAGSTTASSATPESSNESTPSSEPSAPSSDSTPDSAPDDSAPKAFDPSLPPVKVAFGSLEGGAFSLPEARVAFEQAVDHVNTELGGIDGHEMDIVLECKLDVTPESAVDCANQAVEADVAAYIDGVNLGIDAMLPIFKEAGILAVLPSLSSPGANTGVGDVVGLGPSLDGGQVATALVQAADTGGTKVAYVLADIPAMHSIYDEVVPGLATKLGIEAQVYYYAQPTDWTTFAPTVLSNDADYIVMFGSDPDFLAAIAAFRSSGFTGTINANSFAQYHDLDPAQLENVIVAGSFYNELVSEGVPAVAQDDIDTYLRYRDTDEETKTGNPGPTRSGWYVGLMAADVLRQVDDPTSAAAVLAQAPDAKGRVVFSDQDYDCANPSWPGTTSCTGGVYYFSIKADGTLAALPDQPVDMSGVKG